LYFAQPILAAIFTMKEYTLSKVYKIFLCIVAGLMIVVFAILLIMPFIPEMNSDLSPRAAWIFVLVSLAMITVMTMSIMEAIKGKFVIEHDRVYSVGVLGRRHLMLNEIKGYTVNEKSIFIEPISKEKKRIKVSIHFAKKNEIVQWLAAHYKDLDTIEAEKEKQDILNNEALGWTIEQREQKLKNARRVAKVLNVVGGIVSAWTIFFPSPYEYAILAAIAVPAICIVVMKSFGGLMRANETTKGSPYPNVSLALLVPALAVCLRALLDFSVFSYDNVWLPSILIAGIFLVVLFIGSNEFKLRPAKDFIITTVFSLVAFGYAFGSVVTLNCLYDKSEPEAFSATIISKRVTSGKTTTYYLKLTPWGSQVEADEVSVSEDFYEQLGEGDEVSVYLYQGKFQIPWFIVSY
jgi:hypothetical protein